MARLYAQFGAVVFLIFGVGGLLTGDAGTLLHHLPEGNVGNVTLHLTYTRDILNLVIAGVLGFVGFRAADSIGGEIVLTVGVVLLLLAVIGFANPDSPETARNIASLHFTQPINIFDAITGALGVLCGLGGAVVAEPAST
jgi:hypothetical protein